MQGDSERMPYWDNIAASPSHLRHFEAGLGWKQYDDTKGEDGATRFVGASSAVERALSGALNATNLLFLVGAGSSFCAKTAEGRPKPPGISDLWDAVETAATSAALNEIIGLIPNAANLNKNIEKLLTLCKLYTAIYDDDNTAKIGRFIATAEKAILARVDFVDASTDIASHKSLVRKIARRGLRKPRAKVFTTNYDLCFEEAGRLQQFVVVDGFSHSIPQVYDRAYFSYDIVRRDGSKDAPDYVENVFHLYKLHGSLDWRQEGALISRSKDDNTGHPVLIYPRDSKYQESFAPPYLDMMGAFQAALREPDTALIISGFGFNDDHISRPILSALEANMALRLVVCDLAFIQPDVLNAEPAPEIIPADTPLTTTNAYFKQLRDLVYLGDKRVTLLNGRFEDLSAAMPDLVAETDRERHMERLRKLRDMPGMEQRDKPQSS